ncbi:hypothetical protein HYALB_00004061 [Hymenoscyphus albidus]|uniref:Uncharacterized protein n=1 Tax=Hymenoscyphus albidus TaxID=595503 RepID=A0A9N9M5T6_9HELO|nr:hypothetical protein HYALB_00004061 [Hymenoscyphus albidus]
MLILKFFAATALLSTTVAGRPIGGTGFGVIPPTIKAHPNAPFDRHYGEHSKLWDPPSPKKIPFDFNYEMGKLALLSQIRKSPPKAAAVPSRWVKSSHGIWQKQRPEGSILRTPGNRPNPSASKKQVTWSGNVVGKRSEKNEDVKGPVDGADLEKRMRVHDLAVKIRGAFHKPPPPPLPAPRYPEHRPEGSVLKYPAGHPDASDKKDKSVDWAPEV